MKIFRRVISCILLAFSPATFGLVKPSSVSEPIPREPLKSFTFNYDEPLDVIECSFYLQDSSGHILPVRVDLAKSTPTSLALQFTKINKARYTLDYSLKTQAKETVDGSITINFE